MISFWDVSCLLPVRADNYWPWQIMFQCNCVYCETGTYLFHNLWNDILTSQSCQIQIETYHVTAFIEKQVILDNSGWKRETWIIFDLINFNCVEFNKSNIMILQVKIFFILFSNDLVKCHTLVLCCVERVFDVFKLFFEGQ